VSTTILPLIRVAGISPRLTAAYIDERPMPMSRAARSTPSVKGSSEPRTQTLTSWPYAGRSSCVSVEPPDRRLVADRSSPDRSNSACVRVATGCASDMHVVHTGHP
jgi:hypothetical protein